MGWLDGATIGLSGDLEGPTPTATKTAKLGLGCQRKHEVSSGLQNNSSSLLVSRSLDV